MPRKSNQYGKVVPMDGADVSMAAWAVWSALSTFAKWETERGQPVRSKEGSCFPKVEAVAVRAHCNNKTVRKAIDELEKAGYVRQYSRYGRRSKGEKGEQRSNGYILYPRGDAPISETERKELAEQMRRDVKRLFPAIGQDGVTPEQGK